MLIAYILLFILEIILIVRATKKDDIRQWVEVFTTEGLLFFMPLAINGLFLNASWNNTVLCNPQLNRNAAIFYFTVLMLTILFKYIMVKTIEMRADPNGVKKLFGSILALILIFIVYRAFPKLTEYHVSLKNAKNTFLNDNKMIIIVISIVIIAIACLKGFLDRKREKCEREELEILKAKLKSDIICPKCKSNNKFGRIRCMNCRDMLFRDIRLVMFDKKEILQVCMDLDNEYEDSAVSKKTEMFLKQSKEDRIQVMLVGTGMNRKEIAIIKKSQIFSYFSNTFLSKKRTGIKNDTELINQAIAQSGVQPNRALFFGDSSNGKLYIAKELGMNCVYTSAIIELDGGSKK